MSKIKWVSKIEVFFNFLSFLPMFGSGAQMTTWPDVVLRVYRVYIYNYYNYMTHGDWGH